MRRPHALALLCAALAPTGAHAVAPRIQTINDATPIFRYAANLSANVTYTFRTDGLSVGGDTVLHLVRDRDGVEVARNDDRAVGQPASTITYTVPGAFAGDHTLYLRAKGANSGGTCDLFDDRNGVTFHAVNFGGVPVAVDSNFWPNVFETALVAGGSPDTRLLALDANGRFIAFSDDEGVGLASRIDGSRYGQTPATMIVASYSIADRGRVKLYINDSTNDQDHDGLGVALETELGTCDAVTAPGCAQVFNSRDTDRDGLEDSVEVFGLDGAFPQYLQRWGANPRHKDFFIEVDVHTPNLFPGLDANAAHIIGADWAAAPVAEVVNPDGLNGVSVHLDVGRAPTDPADLTLYGDWGGADTFPSSSPSANHFAAERAGLFRQGVLDFNGPSNPDIFNHEFGHLVGLPHEGLWGGLNCSPIYRSTMSYAAFAWQVTGFSDGTVYRGATLNPNRLCESDGLGNAINSHLLVANWALPGPGNAVDWNRDGVINDCNHPVRAPINWYGPQGCDAQLQNEANLASAVRGSAPAIARMGGFVYVFVVDGNGNLRYQRSRQGGEYTDGGCPSGSAPGSGCTTWLGLQSVPGDVVSSSVNAFSVDGRIHLTFVAKRGAEIQTLSTATQDVNGVLTNWTPVATLTGTSADRAPEMQVIYGDPARFGGQTRSIVMAWTNPGIVRYALLDPNTMQWMPRGNFLNAANGAPLQGAFESPTMVFWGHDDGVRGGDKLTFLLVADLLGVPHLYRALPAGDTWTDVSASMPGVGGHLCTHKMGMAFRQLTDGNGAVIDPLRGEFSIAYGNTRENGPAIYWISDVVDTSMARRPETTLAFNRWGRFGQPFYNVDLADGGFDLFTDAQLPYLKGAAIDSAMRARFYPHADGIFNLAFNTGTDFVMMERGICRALRGAQTNAYCGSRGTNGF